jgi:hypothetical protein
LKFCPACGNKLDKPTKFCPVCGNNLQPGSSDATKQNADSKTKKDPKTASVSSARPENTGKAAASVLSPSGEMNPSQVGLWSVVSGNLFLVFSILFSANLLYQLFSGFSFIKVVTSILTILTCIGLWLIFLDAKNGMLSKGGFSIIKIVATLKFIFYFCIEAILFVLILQLDLGVKANLIVFLFLLILLLYWIALLGTTSRSSKIAHGSTKPPVGSFYITFVLCLNIFFKVCSFIWLNMVQHTTNEMANSVLAFGSGASSELASMLNGEGLNYALGYDVSSSMMNSVLQPAAEWIQSTFSVSLDIPGTLLAIAVLVCEIMILSKLRAYNHKNR